MLINVCQNAACGKEFQPVEDPRQLYCCKDCKKVVRDEKYEKRKNDGFSTTWREKAQAGAKVYLDVETTIVFLVVHSERDIAWLRPMWVSPKHECLNDGRCWCDGEKLVSLSRCQLASDKTKWV